MTQRLLTEFTGDLLTPASADYHAARQIWNGMIDRRPDVIARCSTQQQVQQIVRFAAGENIFPAIRAGGHNVAGTAMVDGGLVIDISRMKGISIDADARTATAEAGLVWREFDSAAASFGLATTGGLVSTTGIAGLTLGGGVGWLIGRFGLACDNTLAYDLINADGDAIRATTDENPDLFWALKGGGGNFGVVTSITFRRHPLHQVVSGMLIFAQTEGKQVLRRYRDLVSSGLPDELIVYAAAFCTPDGMQCIGVIPAYSGDNVAEARTWMDQLKNLGTLLADTTTVMPYLKMQQMFDGGTPYGIRSYWKSNFLEALTDEAIDTFIDSVQRCPSPLTFTILEHAHGAAVRVAPDATAFPNRREGFDLVILSLWNKIAEDAVNTAWTREMFSAMRPWSQNLTYVNSFSEDDGDRIAEAFGSNLPRLSRVKAKYDPLNRFQRNHNILPATAAVV